MSDTIRLQPLLYNGSCVANLISSCEARVYVHVLQQTDCGPRCFALQSPAIGTSQHPAMNAAAVEVAAAPEAHEARKLHARLNTASRMSRRDGDRTITFCFRQSNPECTYSAYRIGDYTSGRIVNTQCQKPLSSSWWSSVLWKRAVLSPVHTSDNVALFWRHCRWCGRDYWRHCRRFRPSLATLSLVWTGLYWLKWSKVNNDDDDLYSPIRKTSSKYEKKT